MLTIILESLMDQTLNPDSLWLAMNSAQHKCQDAGLSSEEFNRIREIIVRRWAARRGMNPLSGMF